MRKTLENPWILLALSSLVTLLIYFPVIDGYFLHTDDYFWSFWGGFTCPAVIQWILPIGRPLAGLVYCAYPLVDNFSAMGLFRLLSLLNLSFILFLLTSWLSLFGISRVRAFLFGVLVICLPAFQVYTSYLSTFPHELAVTFSLLSLFCAREGSERGKIPLSAIFLLVLALCFNQATALFFVAALASAICLMSSKEFLTYWAKRLPYYGLVLIISLSTYYLCFRISATLFTFRDMGKYDGRNFVTNYGQRFQWFIKQPFYEVSNLWIVEPSRLLQFGVLTLILIWIIWEVIQSKREALYKNALLIFLIPVGYGISLVSSDPSPEYRTYAALGTFFVAYLFLPLLKKKLGVYFSIIAMGFAAYTAHTNVIRYFVLSDSTEFLYVKKAIQNHLEHGKKLEWIHIIPVSHPVLLETQRNEMGEPTIRHIPNIAPLVLAALSETQVSPLPRITTSGSIEEKQWNELKFDPDTIESIQRQYPPQTEDGLILDLSKVDFSKIELLKN